MSPPAPDPLRHLRPSARQLAEEVDEEIRLHLELRAAELERQGWSPAAARQEALRRFGDVTASRAACVASDRRRHRSMHRREYLGELAQDFKLAFRQLRRRPLFALAATLTLAVGIGATTVVWSAADHVLLRPLPYADPERVVTLWETDEATGERHKEVAAGNFFDWQERNRSFSAMGLAEPSGFDLTGDGPPRSVAAWRVTAGFFAALGVEPAHGRAFLPEEYREGAPAAVLISDGLWRRRFGAAPGVVGSTIELDGAAVTVAGVLPPQIEYPGAKDLWVPNAFAAESRESRLSGYMFAVARLRPRTTLAQAQADLDRVARALAGEHPSTNRTAGVHLVPLPEQIFSGVRPALIVLLAAVGLLLLIACANVANLLLARGLARERELAVLAALGAGRSRLTRQLLLESVLLAALGGAAGIGLAFLGVRVLAALVPPGLPRVDDLGLDGRVLAFAAAMSLLTALLFGLVPALRFSRPDLLASLRGGRGATEARSGARLRGALVVAEIALALVLLVGAGLLANSFLRLRKSDPGFEVERRASLQLFLWDRNPTIEKRRLRVAEIAERLRSVPGALDAGVVSALPFHPSQIDAKNGVQVEGEAARRGDEVREAYTTVASPEYFRVMAIPLYRGRGFTTQDRAGTPPVAVINETMARRFFPGEDPVGRRLRVGVMDRPLAREIVGVVGDVRPTALDSAPRPELYVPFEQSGTGSVTFVVRTAGDPAALLPALAARIWEVDRGQTIYHAATLDELVAGTLRERRFNLVLLGTFSAIALALSALGIYGLTSFSVHQRKAEIGIRLALGARPADIVRMVVGEGLGLGGLGVGAGLAGAALLTHFLRHMLYGVAPTDATTFVETALFMLALTALGAFIPAARATAADPLDSLRRG